MYISELRDGEIVKTEVSGVNFQKTFDVVISGLGTAGAPAALFASENGLSVLGIESFNAVGGTTTIGGIQEHYFGTPGGRHMEIDRIIDGYKAARTRNKIESKKLILEDLIIKSGAEILYESSVIGVYLEDNVVIGVKVITPDGIINVASKVLMDCTGDAYTAYMAGVETVYGRELDGLTQPYSMVSTARAGKAMIHTNRDFGRVDQRNDEDLSRALIFSRAYEMPEERGVGEFVIHMPLIGVREGRRIVAEETVKVTDIFDGTTTKEPMFYSYADLDKHGWDIAFDGEELGDWSIGANLGAYNVTVPVPFKAIIPKSIDGILVPCRALGVGRDVASCVRMIPDMKKIAEAAADIAYLSVRDNISLREVPYAELKERLEKSGCLDHRYNRGFRIDGWRNFDGSPLIPEDVRWIENPEDLEKRLSTLKPGLAIWSSKMMGETATETLIKLLDSEDENTCKHAAFALAINGKREALPILLSMAKDRDPVMLQDCRKHNRIRGVMAVYYLGRLGCKECVDTLIEMITDPEENKKYPVYRDRYALSTTYSISEFNDNYYQFITGALTALIRIANANPELRERIAAAFKSAFKDNSYIKRITTRPLMSSEGSMTVNIKNVAYSAIKRWEE